MKKFREITTVSAKILAAVLMCGFCLIRPEAVGDAVSQAIQRCLASVIPSLYAMMAVSAFLVKSGLTERLPKPLRRLGRRVFGMDGNVFAVFIFSMFAGYPVGAKMLASEAAKGSISMREAELWSGVCFGAGPAFIFGYISSRLYGTASAGRLILFSCAAANIFLALLLSLKLRKKSSPVEVMPPKLCLNAKTMTESILSAGRSMADICIMIAAFSVISAFLSHIGFTNAAAALISRLTGLSENNACGFFTAFLDVTAASALPHRNYSLLPYVCALVSFGGVCVIMQISALTSDKIRVLPIILLRTAAAALSAAFCALLMPLLLSEETVSAADISVSAHSASSPVPSLLLILMTVILFGEYEKLCTKKAFPVCDK